MAEITSEMGFIGLDLTVRPRAHVLPERVQDDLPKSVDALLQYELNPSMMTTEVWNLRQANQ